MKINEKTTAAGGSPHGLVRRRSREFAARCAERLERATSTKQSGLLTTSHEVAAVMVAWDPLASQRCAHGILERLERVSRHARLILVDNRGTGMEWAAKAGFETVAGDNSAGEFSGLRAGIDHLRQVAAPAVWVLANDRYLAYDESALDYLDGGTIDAVVATNSVAGRINAYPATVRAFGLDIGSWARSNLLVVADEALRRLSPLVKVGETELAAVVGPVRGEQPLVRADGPLDALAARYLTEWLTGDGSDLNQHWYRHRPVSGESWDDLTRKVQSILNEQLLSARASDMGIPVLPIHLAHRMGRLDPASALYRSMVKVINQRPVSAVRWLRGTVGRDLFAVQAWLEERRLSRP